MSLSISSASHVMALQVSIVTQSFTQKNSFSFPGRKGQLPPNSTTTVLQFRRHRHWELRSRYRSSGNNFRRKSAFTSSGASAQVEESSRTDEHHQEVGRGDKDKLERYEEALRQIKEDISIRAENLHSVNEAKLMNSELQFAKQLMAQDRFSQAVPHLDKVSAHSRDASLLHCESELKRGICLEKLGMHSDAREALEGVAHTKAPFPHVRRRAAQELWAQKHADMELVATQTTEDVVAEQDSAAAQANVAANFHEYLYDMFSTGFGSLHDNKIQVDDEEEKLMLRIIAISALLIGPVILGWLVMTNL